MSGSQLVSREVESPTSGLAQVGVVQDRSKEPTIMDRFERLSLHVTVQDESMHRIGCGTKLSGDDAIIVIRRVLWEGTA